MVDHRVQERGPAGVVLRPAGEADRDFLTQMLVAAAFWRPDEPDRDVRDVLAQPALAHYVTDWPRAGDLGVVAQAATPVGAAWLRHFTDSDPGYGFVDEATPEVAIGVRKQWRGRGIGTRLLQSLIDRARAAGSPGMSLSVEPDNPARLLYDRLGFVPVEDEHSLTMLLRF